jgi:hypothetical protein
MAIEVMAQVFKLSKASPAAKLVLLAIADHQGERGAWPSERTLARACNMSERSVRRKIAELVELGELEVIVNAAPVEGQYKSNLYWVRVANSGSQGGQNEQSGWTDLAVRVDNVGHQTIKNHKRTFNEDWKPSEDLTKWAMTVNPDLQIDLETANMVDYLLASGKAAGVKDMDARFRTWVRNSVKFQKPKPKEEYVKFVGDRL